MKRYGVLCLLFALALPLFAEADLEATLQTLTRPALESQQPRLNRFGSMRYFPPRNTVQEAPSWWDNLWTNYTPSHERALAFYLFNMYVSARAYNTKSVSQVTLNFLGTLDAFSMLDDPFPLKESESFYRKHKTQIQTWLTDFFKQSNLGTYRPNEPLELSFVRALAKAPVYRKKPGYVTGASNLLKGTISPADRSLLEEAWYQAKNNMVLKAVTFDTPVAMMDAYDTKLARPSGQQAHFYRWVKDECNYSSYMTGQAITKAYTKNRKGWGGLRIYMLTAHPKSGLYVKPAAGSRFVLANGKPALNWQYHTAILVIMNTAPHRYTPIVLDSFLGGDTLLTLDQWLAKFSPNTVFYADPFFRDKTVEDAIQEPQTVDTKDNIYIHGKRYAPAPVEK